MIYLEGQKDKTCPETIKKMGMHVGRVQDSHVTKILKIIRENRIFY